MAIFPGITANFVKIGSGLLWQFCANWGHFFGPVFTGPAVTYPNKRAKSQILRKFFLDEKIFITFWGLWGLLGKNEVGASKILTNF